MSTPKSGMEPRTDSAGVASTPEETAGKVLLSTVAQIDPNDPNAIEKIIGANMVYAKTLGKVDLLKNLTEALKSAQTASVEVRKKFALIVPEIIQIAKTKDIEAQTAEYGVYTQALYGQQTEREKLRLSQVHQGLGGITSGLSIKGLIGQIMTLIPGFEEIGKRWVDEVKAESLVLGETLPNTALNIKRNAAAASIRTGAEDISGLVIENATSMLSPAAVARESGSAIAQMDPTNSDVSFNGGNPQSGTSQQGKPNPASRRAAAFNKEFEDPAPQPR